MQLRVATRRSPLALAQTRAFVRTLVERRPEATVEELLVTTTGDRVVDRPLSEIGGKGLFIKEIEQALLDGRADLAVHSLKDVPAGLAPGLVIGCVPPRADPRDVLCTASGKLLAELPHGSRVGTTSLRRQVQLSLLRPDLAFAPLRGNVETRLRKLAAGDVDAIVLARAGLERLGMLEHATETLSPEQCVPAVGQGALAIEVRALDRALVELLEPFTDQRTLVCVSAERGVLEAVQGSCQLPIAAYAQNEAGALFLRALMAEPDGTKLRRRETRVAFPDAPARATAVGVALGRELLWAS